MSITRLQLAAALLVVAAVALPATAGASTVSVARVAIGDAQVPAVFVDGISGAAPGGTFSTTNRIFIDDDTSCQQFPTSCNTFIVRDLGSSLLAQGPHCRQLTVSAATCTGAQIGDTRHYSVLLGEGNDQLTVNSRYLSSGGAIQGGAGDDAFTLPLRARDLIIGGAGRDTISYLGRTTCCGISVDSANDGVFNDGQAGEDRVVPDVEQVIGTNFDDSIFVPNARQDAGRVPHGALAGANGNDVLAGSPFPDTLSGGAGADVLYGDLGDDTLEGRENASAGQTVSPDTLRCGPGLDTGVMDLRDRQFDCENLSIAAIDEGGTLTILATAKLRDGHARLVLRCPRSSKTRCAGRLSVRRGGRTVGATRYSLGRGTRARVPVRVRGGRGRVRVTAVERDSKGRPKTTIKLVALR